MEKGSVGFDTHFYMIAKPNGLLLILLTHFLFLTEITDVFL